MQGITIKTKLLLLLLLLLSRSGSVTSSSRAKVFPKDKTELLKLVKNEKIKLDKIDTSKIKDMSYLFCLTRDDSHSCPCVEGCEYVFRDSYYRGIEKWSMGLAKLHLKG